MYYSAVSILAGAILLIENQDILRGEGGVFEKPVWNAYRKFLIAVMAYYITDILWGFLEMRNEPQLLFVNTTAYFIAMGIGVLSFAKFAAAYPEDSTSFGRVLEYVGGVLAGFIVVLSLANIFVPVLFTVDADCVYRALPLRYFILVCQILLFLLISIFAAVGPGQNSPKEKRYRALALSGLVMAVFLFLQIWFTNYPLYAAAYLFGTCIIHAFAASEEKEEYRKGMEEAEKACSLNRATASLLDNMPAMAFTKDAKSGVYLTCNQAFADFAHKESPSDVIGSADSEIFDRETAAHFEADDRIALSMEEPFIFYEDVTDADGNRRDMQTTRLKYRSTDGELCLLGMSEDVTDLVRIQRGNAMTKETYEKAKSTGIMFTHIAQALARGYTDLFYVNLDSEEFVTYCYEESGGLVETRRGWHFFEMCRLEIEKRVHPDDRTAVKNALDRKTLIRALDRNETFVMTHRFLTDDGVRYYTMRASRMKDDDRFIVIGLTDVDDQMRQRRAAMRAAEEQIAYTRISALTGNYLALYVVDPATDRYREFSADESFSRLSKVQAGMDFFEMIRESARTHNYPDDLNRFLAVFTRENVMAEIGRRGIFVLSYRLMKDGVPIYVQIKAALLEENEGRRLIVGINDVDDEVKQEEEYIRHISEARMSASIDALTGVKNRHAYLEAEDRLNNQIANRRGTEFGVVLLDVNDLKRINDTLGHSAGDQYIRDACKIICDTFKRSPVFRVGGDEFAVIAQGSDYASIEELVGRMNDRNAKAIHEGGIVIACGMAKYDGDESVESVFERADQSMYKNKSELKTRGSA